MYEQSRICDNRKNLQSMFHPLSGAGQWKKREGCARSGSRAAWHVRKMSLCFAGKAANFAGVWGVPNKQSDRAEGEGAAVRISQRDILTDCLQSRKVSATGDWH